MNELAIFLFGLLIFINYELIKCCISSRSKINELNERISILENKYEEESQSSF
jgi:hypothetical protein